jgi:homoserine O-acetyltransferase
MTARNATALCAFLLAAAAAPASSQAAPIEPLKLSEGDYVVSNFHFASGEALPELRLHYTVLGKPHLNAGASTTPC